MGCKQAFCTLILWACTTLGMAQNSEFIFPLDTSIYLSGTFGEFRGSHFHAGIDIRTFGQEGLPVRCVADGYVSRIKISPYGYGKAIYITHSNGYTSVYGHLSRFPDNLMTYIRKHQYSKRSFSVELLPAKNQFRFKKGQIIAYTGNSGGSYAPHLHFEIRDSKTGEILNPLLFNIGVKDTVAPKILSAFFVDRDRSFKFLTGDYPQEQRIDFNSDTLFTCYLTAGEKALIIAARDFINEDTLNILGNYKVEILFGDAPVYNRTFDRFNFSDARFIQLLSGYHEDLPPLEYCFKEDWNDPNLCHYSNNGWINLDFKTGPEKWVMVKVTDEAGNVSKKHLRILEKKPGNSSPEDSIYAKSMVSQGSWQEYFIFEKAYSFVFDEKTIVDFSHSTFFDSLNVKVKFDGQGSGCRFLVFPGNIKTNEKFRITLPLPDEWKAKESKVCIYREFNDKQEYLGGIVSDGKVQTYSKHFGIFGLILDDEGPEIELYEITDNKIYVRVKDNFSGIKTITGKMDNSWFLLEYDPKTDMLTGELNGFKPGEVMEFTLTVTDNKDNTSHFQHSLKIP